MPFIFNYMSVYVTGRGVGGGAGNQRGQRPQSPWTWVLALNSSSLQQ